MTRINVGVLPRTLTDEHLLAEHREIKRLPSHYLSAFGSNAFGRIPSRFCLGVGHVTFFLDKAPYTLARYVALYEECVARGFRVDDYRANWSLYGGFGSDYRPESQDVRAVVERIAQRIVHSPKSEFRYRGQKITKQRAVGLLYSNLFFVAE